LAYRLACRTKGLGMSDVLLAACPASLPLVDINCVEVC
jgi:hypothetical protein